MNAIPDIFWLKDTKGIFLSCNKRFEQLCGTTEKDIIGKTDYDLVDKEIADFFLENDKNAINSYKPISILNY